MTSGGPYCQDHKVLPVLRWLCVHTGDPCGYALQWAWPSQSDKRRLSGPRPLTPTHPSDSGYFPHCGPGQNKRPCGDR